MGIPDSASLPRLRRLLLVLLVLGLLGTGTELLLLAHYEDTWQVVPLVLIGLGLIAAGWPVLRPGVTATRAFRAVMGLVAASGIVGTVLHYRGNAEFELEMTPNLKGFALFAESMTGATPALAPGAMMLLGLLGLASTYGLASRDQSTSSSTE